MSAATSTEHVPDKSRPESENERSFKGPLQLSGVLDQYQYFNVTPIIGTEFPDTSLKEWIESPNSDALLRDLAITSMFGVYMTLHYAKQSLVSQRGVVFFRKQDDLSDEEQKNLVQRLGELTGKPKSSRLHIHPIFHSKLPLSGNDDEINIISPEQDAMVFGKPPAFTKKQSARQEWHTDLLNESVPSDYTMLRLAGLPKGGGGGINSSNHSPPLSPG